MQKEVVTALVALEACDVLVCSVSSSIPESGGKDRIVRFRLLRYLRLKVV